MAATNLSERTLSERTLESGQITRKAANGRAGILRVQARLPGGITFCLAPRTWDNCFHNYINRMCSMSSIDYSIIHNQEICGC